jgi:hypothetical protein
MNTFKNSKLLAFVAVLLFAGFAFAGAMELHYSQLAAAPEVTHDAVAAVDSTGIVSAEPEAAYVKPTHGNPKVTAKVQGSVASATVTATCYLWFYDTSADTWTFLGADDEALTVDTQTGESSILHSTTTMPEWDTRGATHYEVRLTTVSAGNITIMPWAYGSKSGRE